MANFDFSEIAVLWENRSKKGTTYFKGKMGKSNIWAFFIESENPKAPRLRICISSETEDRGGGFRGGQPADNNKGPGGQPGENSGGSGYTTPGTATGAERATTAGTEWRR